MQNSEEVRFEFHGGVLGIAGWLALAIPTSIFTFAFPWWYAASTRWGTRNTRVISAGPLSFVGKPEAIVLWFFLAFAFGVPDFIYGLFHDEDERNFLVSLASLCSSILGVVAGWNAFKWLIGGIDVGGIRFEFAGGFWGYISRSILAGLSFLTIIGWAWVFCWLYRWIASQVKSPGLRVEFRAAPVEYLWRTLVFVLVIIVPAAAGALATRVLGAPGLLFAAVATCFVLVAIPFVARWITAWMISQIVLVREQPAVVFAEGTPAPYTPTST